MSIYIDISCFSQTNYRAGIQRVLREILYRLLRKDDLSIVLIGYEEASRSFRKLDSGMALEWLGMTEGPLTEKAWLDQRFDLDAARPGDVLFDLDAVWVQTWRRSDLYPRLKQAGVIIVSYLYDIIPYTNPEVLHSGFVVNFLYYMGAALQYADFIFASTQSTLDEIAALQKELGLRKTPGYATWLGADFNQAAGGESPATPHPEALRAASGRFVLMVGTIQPLKNHALVLDAFDKALFERGLSLVIAGRMGWKVDAFEERVRKHPLLGRQLFLLEGMDDATIEFLYNHAFCVAFATLREGFGLPTIEAFQHGAPVLASDIPVLREVGGDFCRYFDPHSPDAFISAISPLLDSPETLQALREKIATYRPVTWDAVADKTAELLRKVQSQSLFRRLFRRIGRWRHSEDLLPDYPSSGAGNPYADLNVGSPVRFYLPCHSGISVDMNENIWTDGPTTCIRLKMHGPFKALCLSADLSSFNGAQPVSLFANDTLVDRFTVRCRSKWLFSIPSFCIGPDKILVLRLEFEKAITPDELIHNGDKRRLALRLFDMRFFAEEDYYLCKRGELMSFAEEDGAQALWYCKKGVSHAEKKYTWTCADNVLMYFFFSSFEGMPHTFTLHYSTFLPEERVVISIGDCEIANFIARGEETRTFDLPASLQAAEGFIELALHLPDVISPKELGKGADVRQLALRLYSMRFD